MSTDIDKIEEVFDDLTNLAITEEDTTTENTYYIRDEDEGQQNFNYIPSELVVIVNIYTRAEFNNVIDDAFRKALQLKGLNLINKSFSTNNKQGELRITSFRCLEI